jgi:hypothetical protein
MIARAETKCADLPNVRFSVMKAPMQWPLGLYDLVVISGALHSWGEAEVDAVAARLTQCLSTGGFAIVSLLIGDQSHCINGDLAAARFVEAASPALSADFQWQEGGVCVIRLRRAA